MHDFHYALVRFVPDVERMEPINVGVILQGQGQLDIRLNQHAAKRKEIDTKVYQQWRSFLQEEVTGKPTPLFQPAKSSPKFLDYLTSLCDGAVVLSRPMIVSVDATMPSADLLDRLYQRLVASPPATALAEANRPTGQFRHLMDEFDFLRRGMKRFEHVKISNDRRWMPYRHVKNGKLLAIDKVEVSNRIGETANEIQALATPLSFLDAFLSECVEGLTTEYVLLADTFESRFADQTEAEFALMKEDLERAIERVQAAGGTVIRSVPETTQFAQKLNHCLPALATSA